MTVIAAHFDIRRRIPRIDRFDLRIDRIRNRNDIIIFFAVNCERRAVVIKRHSFRNAVHEFLIRRAESDRRVDIALFDRDHVIFIAVERHAHDIFFIRNCNIIERAVNRHYIILAEFGNYIFAAARRVNKRVKSAAAVHFIRERVADDCRGELGVFNRAEINFFNSRCKSVFTFRSIRQINFDKAVSNQFFGIRHFNRRLIVAVCQTVRQKVSESADMIKFLVINVDRLAGRIFERQRIFFVERQNDIVFTVVKAVKVRLRTVVSDHALARVEYRRVFFKQSRVNHNHIADVVIKNNIFLAAGLHLEHKRVNRRSIRRSVQLIIAGTAVQQTAARAALQHIFIIVAVNLDVAFGIRRVDLFQLRIDHRRLDDLAFDCVIDNQPRISLAFFGVMHSVRQLAVNHAAAPECRIRIRAEVKSDRRRCRLLVHSQFRPLIAVEFHRHDIFVVFDQNVRQIVINLAENHDGIPRLISRRLVFCISDHARAGTGFVNKNIRAVAAELRRAVFYCRFFRRIIIRIIRSIVIICRADYVDCLIRRVFESDRPESDLYKRIVAVRRQSVIRAVRQIQRIAFFISVNGIVAVAVRVENRLIVAVQFQSIGTQTAVERNKIAAVFEHVISEAADHQHFRAAVDDVIIADARVECRPIFPVRQRIVALRAFNHRTHH